MPPVEVLAVRNQPIGASSRQPRKALDVLGCQDLAVRHEALAVVVTDAAAGLGVEQVASDVSKIDLTCGLIL